ncbi:MAG TPA: glycosyl transferase family 2, partial [Pseudorhodoplanes sp.]|nr:glycosyl transferase family 2 [Pseudorhodoplanes sp.]
MRLLAPHTRAIRTYSATDGAPYSLLAPAERARTVPTPDAASLVPGIANEFGLKVTAGAWLSGVSTKNNDVTPKPDFTKRNERELAAIVDLPRKNPNIDSVVVGNETVYRGETIFVGDEANTEEGRADLARIRSANERKERIETAKKWTWLDKKEVEALNKELEAINKELEAINVARLIKIIQRVKRETQVPVTTGEIWSVWESHPELVSVVDFIAVHILPYWEGKPSTAAVDDAIGAYNRLRQMYPGKRIVIAEFGWPSGGYNIKEAVPGRLEQATVLRDFVSRAQAHGIDYNIIEAIDQQWKVNEGSVGAYWGLYDASRQEKFAWSGVVVEQDHWKNMTLAVLFGLLLSAPIIAMRRATFGQAMLLGTSANAAGAWFATVFAFWKWHYFVWGAAFALGLGIVLLIPLVFIALARMEEIAAVAFGRKPRRLLPDAPSIVPDAVGPKVSIHIPAYREPPEMLKATLDAVATLTYPNFECIVIINNTP